MRLIPPLNSDHGYLPVGRYAATRSEVEARFVNHEDFRDHGIRRQLWEEWQWHLTCLEATLGTLPRVWLAGSFVTAKKAPSDIDVFYGMPPTYYDALAPEDLEDVQNLLEREWCVRNNMRIDAYGTRLPDEAAVDDLRPSMLGKDNLQAFQSLGIYDEIWQRSRLDPPARRGYLEVQL